MEMVQEKVLRGWGDGGLVKDRWEEWSGDGERR